MTWTDIKVWMGNSGGMVEGKRHGTTKSHTDRHQGVDGK